MPGPQQQSLFAPAPPSAERPGPVGPAQVQAELARLGEALPPLLRMGTSSWAYPGWVGLVYDRVASESSLAQRGLLAYGRHPLLRTVGIDRTHYAPLEAAAFAELAEQVPEHFRFLAKAHDALTLARFPRHARYGARQGERNERFLDAAYASEAVVGPFAEGLGKKAGPLLFQLAPQDVVELGGPLGFPARLHRFLGSLPKSTFYAVEVRNAALVVPALGDALAAARAAPCLLAWPHMPDLETQARVLGVERSPALVIRWMLHRSMTHESAGAKYAPFDRIQDEDPETRAQIASLAAAMLQRNKPVLIIVNNNAEGSAPRSIERLARAVSAALAGRAAGPG